MNGPTHAAGGLCAGVAVSALHQASPTGAGAAALGALFAARLPDLDRFADTTYNHRSVTHSPLVVVVAAIVAAYLLPYGELAQPLAYWAKMGALGFVAGYGSHLLLDAITPARIPWLTKGGPRVGIGLVNTKTVAGALAQGAVLVGSGAGTVVVAIYTWGGGIT